MNVGKGTRTLWELGCLVDFLLEGFAWPKTPCLYETTTTSRFYCVNVVVKRGDNSMNAGKICDLCDLPEFSRPQSALVAVCCFPV